MTIAGNTFTVNQSAAVVPVAQFTGSPTNGAAPLVVTFTDTSTGTITNRYWTFGDGATTRLSSAVNLSCAGGRAVTTVEDRAKPERRQGESARREVDRAMVSS